MDEEEIKTVVIATTNPEKALYILSKDAMLFDELEIHYTDKYAPTIEYLLRILRKGFGWMEIDRGVKEVFNTRCKYYHNGFCKNPELTKNGLKKCNELIRQCCKKYLAKYKERMLVNYVLIEKAGGIRNM